MCSLSTTKVSGKLPTPLAIGQAGEGDRNMAGNLIDLFAVNPHSDFYINGNINSYPVQFMMDMGAAVSLIDSNTWNRVKGRSTLKPWVNPKLVGVNGAPLKVEGTAATQLEINGSYYPLDVIVADLRTEAILGIDFLEANQCTLNLPRGLISLNGTSPPVNLIRTGPKVDSVDNVSVVLPNDVCIPGSSEMEINAVLQGPTEPGTLIVEQVILPSKPFVLIATEIVDSQRSVDHSVGTIQLCPSEC